MNSRSDPWFDSWKALTVNSPWQSSLEDWWNQFSQQSTSSYLPALEKIVDQSRLFFQMADKLNDQDAAKNTGNWQERLDQIFNGLKRSFDVQDETQPAQLFWQMPLANWQRTVSSLSSLPGDAFSATYWHGELAPHKKLDQFLSTPGVGYAREHQAEYQKLSRLLLDYQKAFQKYATFFVKINKQALDRMRDRLLTRAQGDEEPITTVRELYNLWIDCSEHVYSQNVLTDDYAKMHGEMINALMALKQQGGRMMDDFAGTLNMPTREEMDTIHQRFQASRREHQAIQSELSTTRLREEDFAGQLGKLWRKIDRIDHSAGSSANKRKKNIVKKKAVKKKKKSAKKPKSR